jgi:adenine-specific DNA-methyltransferase
MALVEELLREIQDDNLRERALKVFNELKSSKKFGLSFEEHLPEVLPLYNETVVLGSLVARKLGKVNEVYRVVKVKSGDVVCFKEADSTKKEYTFKKDEVVVVKKFGEPIFPALIPVGHIERDKTKAHHLLIEADNYHALQLLEYVHRGQVDCIYIDPPYNTGARDWKYNNDYVDNEDQWRHSKWLSFMRRRLELAKTLLKPDTGVLIVTIDEHEVHHLGMLLAQLFPESVRQMVTIVINPKGVAQGKFSRVEEYAFFVFNQAALVKGGSDDLLTLGMDKTPFQAEPRWAGLLRSGTNARRDDRPTMFYPVLVDPDSGAVVDVGDILSLGKSPDLSKKIRGLTAVWPIRTDGSFGYWMHSPGSLKQLISKGYVTLGRFDPKRNTYALSYLNRKIQRQIDDGDVEIISFDKKSNSVQLRYKTYAERQPKKVWHRSLHDAGAYGSDLLKSIIGQHRVFSFPKSLYAVRDCLAPIVRENKDALILDFFAGSGTTLHATALLNAEDGGNRRCILVTNNEVSDEEAKTLTSKGLRPGSNEWERKGICRSVTFPRCKFTLAGQRDDGAALEGTYYTGKRAQEKIARNVKSIGFVPEGSLSTRKSKKSITAFLSMPQNSIEEEERWAISDDMAILFDLNTLPEFIEALSDSENKVETIFLTCPEGPDFNDAKTLLNDSLPSLEREVDALRSRALGFNENLQYLKLEFLDPTSVELGDELSNLILILWIMSGSKGKIPKIHGDETFIASPDCSFALLLSEKNFKAFLREISRHKCPAKIFVVTNSMDVFQEMRSQLRNRLKCKNQDIVHLYRNYLENFQINTGIESK